MSNPAYKRRWEQAIRDRFFEMYGKQCACCGEGERTFLTLDHVWGDGGKARFRGPGKPRSNNRRAYQDAIQEHQPLKYQVLCQNCNHAWRVGVCPHAEVFLNAVAERQAERTLAHEGQEARPKDSED